MDKFLKKKTHLNMALLFFLIFIVSYCIHVSYVFYLNMSLDKMLGVTSDSVSYMKAADDIRNGYVFKKGYISSKSYLETRPGYPFYLALVKTITNDNIFWTNIVRLSIYPLISTLTCYLSYITIGMRKTLFVIPFTLFSPILLFWNRHYLTDGLFTLLVVMCVICIIKIVNNKNAWFTAIVGGMVFSCASWTRPILLPFIFFVILWFFMLKKYKNIVLPVKTISVFLLTIFFTFNIWTVRNLIVTGETNIQMLKVLDRTKKELSAHKTKEKIVVDGLKKQPPAYQTTEKALDSKKTPGHSIFHKTVFYLNSMFKSFKIYWHISMRGSTQNLGNSNFMRVWVFYYSIAFTLLVLSLFFTKNEFAPFSLFWLFIVYINLVYMTLTFSSGNVSRHRIPLEPYISILSGYSLWRIYKYFMETILKKHQAK